MDQPLLKLQVNHRLKIKPYPYQLEGIDQGLKWKRFILGDEPGLGKTLQSIGVVDTADAYPCLVICPSSLKINWQREFEKFTDKKALILDNSVKNTFGYLLQMKAFHIAICNYESLRSFFVWDCPRKKSFRVNEVVFSPLIQQFKSIIIDESHRVKDASTQQAKFTKGICVGKEYIILLSGTPVVNRPSDLISQLAIMDRLSDFGGMGTFNLNYCGGERHASNLGELSNQLYSSCMIRREKATVLTQLPDKTRSAIYTEISNEDEYNTAVEDLAEYLRIYRGCSEEKIRQQMHREALMRFMTLRGIAAKGKVVPAIDFVRNFIESGNKLVLFCSLHEIADQFKSAFPKAVTVTGRDSQAMKQFAVDSFQNNPECKLIICSIKAAGVGLTLTASSTVAFVEFPWTYSDCCQCEDRVHRIGQKDNVLCYYLLAKGTIDHKLYNIIQDKKSIANQIMAASDDIPTDTMYFEELVESILS